MQCTQCRELFDGLIEGTLPPALRAAVDAHVDGCSSCEGLLRELRVVDALLLEPRRIDPAGNFTFRVMAEVRSMSPPAARRTPHAYVLATYLAFAWIAIALWFALEPQSARDSLAVLRAVLMQAVEALGIVTASVYHLFGRTALGATASVWIILSLDVIAAASAAGAFLVVRPRLLARLATPPEVR